MKAKKPDAPIPYRPSFQESCVSYRPSKKENRLAEIEKWAKKLGITRNRFIDQAVLEKIHPGFVLLHDLERKLWKDIDEMVAKHRKESKKP